MALIARYLADTSALSRLHLPAVREVLEPAILDGRVATCGIVELEVLYSARSHADAVRIRRHRDAAFERVAVEEHDFRRAEEVLLALALKGQHRIAGLPDLLIAACAERAGLVLLHYDADFDAICAVTGQPGQWVVARGSVD